MTRARHQISNRSVRREGPLSSAFARNLSRLAATIFLFTTAVLFGAPEAAAQAVYTATGPGSFISVGVAVSGFQQDYGTHYVGGETVFVDANLYRRIGIEAEVRRLNYRTIEDVKENTYLVGPRYTGLGHNLRPYAKFLIGRGTLDFPYHYAVGTYFVMAPAAGLDWHLGNSRFTVRVADFQYQIWPQFTYGELHPYGITSGISFDVFTPSDHPRGRHF